MSEYKALLSPQLIRPSLCRTVHLCVYPSVRHLSFCSSILSACLSALSSSRVCVCVRSSSSSACPWRWACCESHSDRRKPPPSTGPKLCTSATRRRSRTLPRPSADCCCHMVRPKELGPFRVDSANGDDSVCH